jgi:hypothetical protein
MNLHNFLARRSQEHGIRHAAVPVQIDHTSSTELSREVSFCWGSWAHVSSSGFIMSRAHCTGCRQLLQMVGRTAHRIWAWSWHIVALVQGFQLGCALH